MLTVNVKEGQQIQVGPDLLTVDEIETNAEGGSTLHYRLGVEKDYSATLATGELIQLMPQVAMIFTRAIRGNSTYAVLGFDAPKRIRIRGTWNTERR